MKDFSFKVASAVLLLGMSASPLQAQASDDAFIECMRNCQDFQPDAKTVRQCENWCYARYNPR